MEEEHVFHNGKELLDGCAERLGKNQGGEVGGNMALYPVVIVMLGERSGLYTEFIKDTLDDNWNNSRFMQYVNIVKSEESWKCFTLKDVEKKHQINWKASEGEPNEVLSSTIVEMLQQPDRIFKNKNSVKIDVVMDSDEENGEDYYDLYLRIRSGVQADDLKTFYLMADQRPQENRAENAEKIWQYVFQKSAAADEKCGTTYLLSNYLASGRILGDDSVWENYRLVADIILLGGNGSGNNSTVSSLYNGIKTASYALVLKPTNEIAAASLHALMREMQEEEKKHYLEEISEQDIGKRLDIQAAYGFGFAEELFHEKIQKHLPEALELQYLPFRSEKELKGFQRVEQISDSEADSYTMGTWTLLQQKKYIDVAESLLNDEEELENIRKEIQDLLHRIFSLFEVRKMESRKNAIRQLFMEELQFEGVGKKDDYTERLYKKAVYECKKHFYKRVKEILWEEFQNYLEQAKDFEALYKNCQKEVEDEKKIVMGDGDESIQTIYEAVADTYVKTHRKINSTESAFPRVFDVRFGKKELLSAIWEVFVDLIQDKIFHYDFEEELSLRMGNMTDANRQTYVDNELQKKLSGSIRLKNLFHIQKEISCFYLINDTAAYAKQLEQRQKDGHKFRMFNLNRTDCIEQIKIYEITKPENVRLRSSGEETE